jgi:hypothetical protein
MKISYNLTPMPVNSRHGNSRHRPPPLPEVLTTGCPRSDGLRRSSRTVSGLRKSIFCFCIAPFCPFSAFPSLPLILAGIGSTPLPPTTQKRQLVWRFCVPRGCEQMRAALRGTNSLALAFAWQANTAEESNKGSGRNRRGFEF